MNDTLIIREAVLEDADKVAAIHVAMWQHAYKHFLPKPFLMSLSVEERGKFRKRLLQDTLTDKSHFVALLNGKIVGFCDFGEGRDVDSEALNGQIYALYIDPTIMRKGVGATLLERAERGLKEMKYRSVTLWLIAENTIGRRFYEKYGYNFDDKKETVTNHGVTYDVVRYKKIL